MLKNEEEDTSKQKNVGMTPQPASWTSSKVEKEMNGWKKQRSENHKDKEVSQLKPVPPNTDFVFLLRSSDK